MPTAYYPRFDVAVIDTNGNTQLQGGEILDVYNVTASVSLGTVTADGEGVVAEGSFSASPGDVIEYSSGSYPLTFRQTLGVDQDAAYSMAENNIATYVLENNYAATTESETADIYLEDLDTTGQKPIYLGNAPAGSTTVLPYQTGVNKNIRLRLVSKEPSGRQSFVDLNDAPYADMLIPPVGGIKIGSTAILSGTDGRIIFQASGVASQSGNLTFASDALTVNGIRISSPFHSSNMFVGAANSVSFGAYYATMVGVGAGAANTSANYSTFIGYQAGGSTTSGSDCTFIGASAGAANTTQSENTFIGARAGQSCTASGNTFIGAVAGGAVTSGANLLLIGAGAGASITSASSVVALGTYAGLYATGSNSVFVGARAGLNMTGSGGVFIGAGAGENETASDRLYIANSNTTTPLIYGEFNNSLLRVHGNLYARKTSGAQIIGEYDGSNNITLTVGSAGETTIDGAGSSKGVKFATGYKIGFFGTTPVGQRTDFGALTDSTSGAVGSTLGSVSATVVAGDGDTINDNFASVLDKINAIRTVLRDLGFMP